MLKLLKKLLLLCVIADAIVIGFFVFTTLHDTYTATAKQTNTKDSIKKKSKQAKEKKDTISENIETMDDGVVYLDDFPPIHIVGNGTILEDSYELLVEGLQDSPRWLLTNCSAIYLDSDEIFNNLPNSDDASSSESIGMAISSDKSVHIRSPYFINNDDEFDCINENYYFDDTALSYIKRTIYHELAHLYDYANGISDSYDTSILQNNSEAICNNSVFEFDQSLYDYCTGNPKELFADAVWLYCTGESVPSSVRGWISNLPK